MFKNVFLKYVSAFMLINLVIFAVLISVITSLVNSYATNAKINTLSKAAYSLNMLITDGYRSSPVGTEFTSFLEAEVEQVASHIDLLSINTDHLIILIADSEGKVLLSGASRNVQYDEVFASYGSLESIPQSVIGEVLNGGVYTRRDVLGGVFALPTASSAAVIKSSGGEAEGIIFVCTAEIGMDSLLNAMIKTAIMSCLWLMLASLVAVYFISEKFVDPLRSMSRAAKQFAKGQFDVRVPVTGNDEVAELAEAFNNMASSLSTAENMRRSFLANVSHDLRTPMTTISGFIDGIIEGAIPKEKHSYYLGVIADEVRRLSRLVSALLDISRMQAGERKFTVETFDICEMARQILISFEQKIDGRRLEVEFISDRDNMSVDADRDAIHQILYNIIDNALKFSREGGALVISITDHGEGRQKKALISVKNDGVGIPDEDIPFIFDRFYKSDKSRGLDKTGVGLGMYISRTIIEAHDEKIWVESEAGSWCKFSFTLKKHE